MTCTSVGDSSGIFGSRGEKALYGLAGAVAITALVIGVLSILAAHGFPFEDFNRLGSIGGGALVSFGLAIPLLILGIACCRRRKLPQFGDRDSDGRVFVVSQFSPNGDWKTPLTVVTMDLGNDEFYGRGPQLGSRDSAGNIYVGNEKGWVSDTRLEQLLQECLEQKQAAAKRYGWIK